MIEVNRRTLLRLAAASVAGAVVAEPMIPVQIQVNREITHITGLRAGNSNTYEALETACNDADNKKVCVQNYKPSIMTKVYGMFIAPIIEELAYRGQPSLRVSMDEQREDPMADVLIGTRGLALTKRELVFGIGSSVLFGAVHNITDRFTIDTKTIPASQTVAGLVYWYLQRKFGIVANTTAHMWNNIRALA